jgi:hypothetical protein
MTPQVVGEVMSKDDPFYSPVGDNPFAAYESYGGKILGYSRNDKDPYSYELPSPSIPHTPPCTPIMTPDGTLVKKKHRQIQQTQSLPSSPVLLRKAAEQFHQESLHGSNSQRYSSLNNKRYSLHFPKSKSSSVLPESLAHRLQFELNSEEDMIKSRSKGQRSNKKYYIHRQLSADTRHDSSDLDDIPSLTNGVGNGRTVYQNEVRDYRLSRSSTDSYASIEEQVVDLRNPVIAETPSEEPQTTVRSDGAILETHL